MSDRAPEHPTPSPYLTWLCSLSDADRAVLEQETEKLVHQLQQTLPSFQSPMAIGIWLHALRCIWQSLEQELSLPKEAMPHE